jgi:hypothetical protein
MEEKKFAQLFSFGNTSTSEITFQPHFSPPPQAPYDTASPQKNSAKRATRTRRRLANTDDETDTNIEKTQTQEKRHYFCPDLMLFSQEMLNIKKGRQDPFTQSSTSDFKVIYRQRAELPLDESIIESTEQPTPLEDTITTWYIPYEIFRHTIPTIFNETSTKLTDNGERVFEIDSELFTCRVEPKHVQLILEYGYLETIHVTGASDIIALVELTDFLSVCVFS